MKPLCAVKLFVSVARPQAQAPIFSTFSNSNTYFGRKVLFYGQSNQNRCYSTYTKLRSFISSKNFFGGYKYYTAALENGTKFTADDYLLMFKLLAKAGAGQIPDETKRIIAAMEKQSVTPTKEHLKAIIECAKNSTLDFAYEIYKDFATKYNIKLESTVFTAYVEACLEHNDVDRALRFISSTNDQDVVIIRPLYVQIISCCLRNLMPSKAIEICKIVTGESEGPFFTPWEFGGMLDVAIQNEEVKAIVYFLEKIKTLDVNKLDEGTLLSILVLAAKFRNVDLAKQTIQLMRHADIEITAPIHFIMARAYFVARQAREGFEYLQTMIDTGMPLNLEMKGVISDLCGPSDAYVARCYDTLKTIYKKRENISIDLVNILIKTCSQLGLDGSTIIDSMETEFGVKPNQESYHCLLYGYSCERSAIGKLVSRIEEMKQRDITIDENTYYFLMEGLSRSGQLDAAEAVLERMREENLTPSPDLLISLGLAFARQGEIDAATKVVDTAKSMGGNTTHLEKRLKVLSKKTFQ